MKSWVFTDSTHGWVNCEDVEFENIEESPFGDVMYFTFKGKSFSSNIVFKDHKP